jgi:hypothetical protein
MKSFMRSFVTGALMLDGIVISDSVPDADVDDKFNSCADDGCSSRASPNDPGVCVASSQACSVGGSCAAGSCGACGGTGQPCCKAGDLPPFCTGAGTACDGANVCVECGKSGQPCCFDYVVGEPTCRGGGKCDRCP